MKDSALLLLFASRHYGWMHWPVWAQGDVYSISASVCIVAIVLALKPWWPLAGWIVGEEALSVACSAWWLLDWAPGIGDQCSTRLDFKVWSIGMVFLAILAYRMTEPVRPSSTNNKEWRIK